MSLMPMVPEGLCLFGQQLSVSHLHKPTSSSDELSCDPPQEIDHQLALPFSNILHIETTPQSA